ncbi:MAG: cytochrome P450 [Acidimicrobiales bacterium]
MLVFLTSPRVLRPVFAVLRRVAPRARFRKQMIVSRHADVVEILRRDEDFTIAEINGPSIHRWSGAFILAMDRGEDYEREAAALRRAAPHDDLPRVRSFVADAAAEIVERAIPRGRLDVVNELSRVVPTRVVASYFGVPGPDEPTMQRWMRAMFDAVFIDFGPRASRAAELTVAEQRPYMEELVRTRRKALEEGDEWPADMLSRLVAMGADEPWMDDDAVRRNVNGVIVGAVDTTSKAVAHVVDELLRRPDALAGARSAALAGDIDAVRAHAWEALRFLPHAPILQRHTPRDTPLGRKGKPVPAGTKVSLGVLSAMFDPAAFPAPTRFRPDRPEDRYLHFGHGLHTCFGLGVNRVQVPELVAAVARLPGLRRAPGAEGKLVYDGPFPDRLVVEFDTPTGNGGRP